MKQANSSWVILAACLLAFLAAATNAIFMLQIGTSVSHLTGDVSKFAAAAAESGTWDEPALRFLATALTGFVAGATVAGVLIHSAVLELTRPYGRSISAIGLTLFAAYLVVDHSATAAVWLTAGACGFQNALATRYRGLVLRTTHVTGLLTDLGMTLGMRLRGRRIAPWKLLVPLVIVLSFSLGAAGGALLTRAAGDRAILMIAAAYLVVGLTWTILKRAVLHIGRSAH